MNDLAALVGQYKSQCRQLVDTHEVCLNKIASIRTDLMRTMFPKGGALYAKINEHIVPVTLVNIQITEVVLGAYRYALDETTCTQPVTLACAQDGVNFFLRYLRDEDRKVFPPFHMMGNASWYSVCLGLESCPNPERLTHLLSTVNFCSSYIALESMRDMLGMPLPPPFNKWEVAGSRLKLGQEVEGFKRINEISIEALSTEVTF